MKKNIWTVVLHLSPYANYYRKHEIETLYNSSLNDIRIVASQPPTCTTDASHKPAGSAESAKVRQDLMKPAYKPPK